MIDEHFLYLLCTGRSSQHGAPDLGGKNTCSPSFAMLVLTLCFTACGYAQSKVPAPGTGADPTSLPFNDPENSFQVRVHDLIGRLTLPEKAAQMTNHAPAIPRLGLPAYDWWSEGLHGVARAGYATVFPQAIGLAAAWDPALLTRVGDVVSTEARIKFAEGARNPDSTRYRGLTLWSPNINIFRDPRWGRGQETYGEDPVLTARMGTAFIRGLQGEDPKFFKVIATPKHFAVHSGPEPLRHVFDARVSAHDLEETYFPAFHAAITEAHAGSLMCSYNDVNGTPACMSDGLLRDVLRGRWNYSGFVVSDCGAIEDIAKTHHAQADVAAASAAALSAGTDMSCGDEYLTLPEAVKRGLITESQVDTSLARLLMARMRLGLFDPPASNPWSNLNYEDVGSIQSRQLALSAALETIVLLKNKASTLPFTNIHRLAVIGPNADSLDVLEGNYNGTPVKPSTVLDGIKGVLGSRMSVQFAAGSSLAAGLPALVPSDRFGPADKALHGLTGDYFANTAFSGDPAFTRSDPSLSFDWRQASPGGELGIAGYSVRWSATILPLATGEITLGTQRGECWDCTLSDSVKLYVEDKLLTLDDGHDKDGETVTAKIQVRKDLPIHVKVEYINRSAEGSVSLVWSVPEEISREQAIAVARGSEAVVLVLGISPQLEGEEMPVKIPGFSGGDRTSLDLPEAQRSLFRAIKSTGKPIVVVLLNGSALALHEIAEQADAILEAWYPGQAGGQAVAEILAGEVSPAGRLPITVYNDVADLPSFEDYSMAHRTYRYFDGPVLYPFGYGLSYTRFEYGRPRLEAGKTPGEWLLSTRVHNTGSVPSDEVVQIYVTPPHRPGTPRTQLVAFRRVHLTVGQEQTVSFELTNSAFATVDTQGKRSNVPGRYELWVGGGQPSSGLPGAATSLQLP